MKNEAFLKKYFAEPKRDKQLSMMKDYMLSLPPEELTEFVKEPIRFLGEALKSNEVSEESKASIFAKLDELTFLLSGKAVAQHEWPTHDGQPPQPRPVNKHSL